MADFVNMDEQVALLRLLEFFSAKKPWARSLWGIGVVLAIEEYYEACTVLNQGHLSEASLKQMASALQKRVGQDPAFSKKERQFLGDQILPIPRTQGVKHFGVRELATTVAADYLRRWGRVVAAGSFSVELFTRSVAAHLLDTGFSTEYLSEFVKTKSTAAEIVTLQQLCDSLQDELENSPRREFHVLLAFSKIPELMGDVPSDWLKGASVTAWLKAHDFSTTGVRSPLGMILKVQARDAVGASQAARAEAERYSARALVATGKSIGFIPMLWVAGSNEAAPMTSDSRGVGVKELYRESRVFSTDVSQSVDAALELMSHLEGSSPPAAVAGGWGAIEGLLADPSLRASAADNLAMLVACSYPRAELTALSHKLTRSHPQLSAEMNTATSNRQRCRILAAMIIEGNVPEMEHETDNAALTRMAKLLLDPGPALCVVRETIAESFHRLYRQRNLILHGGRLDSVALTASLRTVAKLAGAGMDRIVHGYYVQGLQPLELVAKANLALTLVGDAGPLACIDLLEPN